MSFYSINTKKTVGLRNVAFQSIAEDGSLYMPSHLNQLPSEFFKKLSKLSFSQIAQQLTKHFLHQEIEKSDLRKIVKETFCFDLQLHWICENKASLELFHGPTLAFKDFGARFLARVLAYLLKSKSQETTILVATSGDTGSAVASSFYKLKGIQVVLLYPSKRVSQIQEKQLTTYGENITALEVEGTFDDCQKLVKAAFADTSLNKKKSVVSANSINIIRLLPQAFYYFYAYGQVLRKYSKSKKKICFAVPTGNLGNLTGGLMAKTVGLPIDQFIACSNSNDVFPKYLETNQFVPKTALQTISNAMDVGNPNNYPRVLELYKNEYEAIKEDIKGFQLNDPQTMAAMKTCFDKYNYITDPHSAIAFQALEDNLEKSEVGVFLATAHPAKFKDSVESALSTTIPLPKPLETAMKLPKKATLIKADYSVLKEFLMG